MTVWISTQQPGFSGQTFGKFQKYLDFGFCGWQILEMARIAKPAQPFVTEC